MDERLEKLFLEIEDIIAEANSLDELKKIKIAYVNQHRLAIAYFGYIQEQIEIEESV